jgi:hypothetical protein
MPTEETSSFSNLTSASAGGPRNPEQPGSTRLLASAALIGAGLLVEPELLGGALLGAGVVYGLPFVGRLLHPIAATAVQLSYAAVGGVSDLVSGARDQIQSIVATARSDYQRARSTSIIQGH